MTLRGVLFDIDGTLVDSNEAHVNAWALAFRPAGRAQELGTIREQFGKGGDLLVPALEPDWNPHKQAVVASAHDEIFSELYLEHVRPLPGASDLVRRVHADGRRVFLASSAKGAELDHYVDLLELEGIIEGAVSSEDVETSKPAPDIFNVALERSGMKPEDVMAIGDTPYDVFAAAGSGIATIGLTSGPFTADRLKDAGAVAVFADVADLLRRIENSPLRIER
jgi:HAD superfamily hydrolase (TIGR01509 family)